MPTSKSFMPTLEEGFGLINFFSTVAVIIGFILCLSPMWPIGAGLVMGGFFIGMGAEFTHHIVLDIKDNGTKEEKEPLLREKQETDFVNGVAVLIKGHQQKGSNLSKLSPEIVKNVLDYASSDMTATPSLNSKMSSHLPQSCFVPTAHNKDNGKLRWSVDYSKRVITEPKVTEKSSFFGKIANFFKRKDNNNNQNKYYNNKNGFRPASL